MKTNYVFLFVMGLALPAIAQTPNFLFTLKATNALGHTDSVRIGTYIYQGSLSAFGDPISGFDGPQIKGTPVDSNMDIRVSYMNNVNYHTKKRIIPSICLEDVRPPINRDNQVSVRLFAKKWPVRLSWDSTLFVTDSCVQKSFFSIFWPGSNDISFNPESFFAPLRMAATRSHVIIDSSMFDGTRLAWLWYDTYTSTNVVLNNGKAERQYVISFYFNKSLTGSVSTRKPHKSLTLRLYPNPASKELIIEQDEKDAQMQHLKIISPDGKTVYEQSLQAAGNLHNISLSGLKAGLYLVEIKNKDGSVGRQTFIKQ